MQQKFSYSKVNTFTSCPQKYKIQYIDKVFTDYQSVESFMGVVVHKVLYDISQKVFGTVSLDRILNHYDKIWAQSWHRNIVSVLPKPTKTINNESQYKKIIIEKYFMIGKECVIRYLKSDIYLNSIKDDSLARLGTKIKSQFEKKFEFKINNVTLVGVIDRIDFFSNGVIIYDYKTNKKLKSKKQLKKSMQFYIYFLAIKQIEKNIDSDNIIISIYNLVHDKIDNFLYLCDELAELKQSLHTTIQDISLSSDFRPNETPLCNWCYYWKECSIKLAVNLPVIRL